MWDVVVNFGIFMVRAVVGLMLLVVLFETFSTITTKTRKTGIMYLTDSILFILLITSLTDRL